ncbi:hypothetical protein Tsubulata_009252 [Turnera subulata]|uniref:Uncharacterized protein n=1 Tax=Turnera subulata TaxID=218843 RepID=A0A9Q0FZG3_9ROSI|nr:hypothetical protein Tsubulata_009252 [Turnera subulata]
MLGLLLVDAFFPSASLRMLAGVGWDFRNQRFVLVVCCRNDAIFNGVVLLPSVLVARMHRLAKEYTKAFLRSQPMPPERRGIWVLLPLGSRIASNMVAELLVIKHRLMLAWDMDFQRLMLAGLGRFGLFMSFMKAMLVQISWQSWDQECTIRSLFGRTRRQPFDGCYFLTSLM